MASYAAPQARAWARYLDQRVAAVLESVPGRPERRPSGAPSPLLEKDDLPNWVGIPLWLHASWTGAPVDPASPSPLADVLWAQYALFLHIRILDDILDRKREDLDLFIVADRFLLESIAALQLLPEPVERLQTFLRRCLRDTLDGCLEVEGLEREPGGFRAEHLGLHARTGSVFKVGAAGVCHLCGRDTDARWVAAMQDRIAIAGQIEDDLDDLADDLKDDRYTWVANALLDLRRGEGTTPERCALRLAEGLLHPERGAALVAEVRRLAAEAASEVPDDAPPPIRDLLANLVAYPDDLERRLHETRVRLVFGDLLKTR